MSRWVRNGTSEAVKSSEPFSQLIRPAAEPLGAKLRLIPWLATSVRHFSIAGPAQLDPSALSVVVASAGVAWLRVSTKNESSRATTRPTLGR